MVHTENDQQSLLKKIMSNTPTFNLTLKDIFEILSHSELILFSIKSIALFQTISIQINLSSLIFMY